MLQILWNVQKWLVQENKHWSPSPEQAGNSEIKNYKMRMVYSRVITQRFFLFPIILEGLSFWRTIFIVINRLTEITLGY